MTANTTTMSVVLMDVPEVVDDVDIPGGVDVSEAAFPPAAPAGTFRFTAGYLVPQPLAPEGKMVLAPVIITSVLSAL